MATLTKKLNAAVQPLTTDDGLDQQYDADTQQQRAAEDQQLNADPMNGMPGHMSIPAMQFNRMQQDAATGQAGYNRQWVPLLQSLKGKKLRASNTPSLMDDPTSSYNLASGPFGDFGTGTGGNSPDGGDERLQQALDGLTTKGLKVK